MKAKKIGGERIMKFPWNHYRKKGTVQIGEEKKAQGKKQDDRHLSQKDSGKYKIPKRGGHKIDKKRFDKRLKWEGRRRN